MKAFQIVGYTYNRSVHCPDCASKDNMTAEDATDMDDNLVCAVFAGDESWEIEICDGCDHSLGCVAGLLLDDAPCETCQSIVDAETD
jgi:hypothetical protein